MSDLAHGVSYRAKGAKKGCNCFKLVNLLEACQKEAETLSERLQAVREAARSLWGGLLGGTLSAHLCPALIAGLSYIVGIAPMATVSTVRYFVGEAKGLAIRVEVLSAQVRLAVGWRVQCDVCIRYPWSGSLAEARSILVRAWSTINVANSGACSKFGWSCIVVESTVCTILSLSKVAPHDSL